MTKNQAIHTRANNQTYINTCYVNALIRGVTEAFKDKQCKRRQQHHTCVTCFYMGDVVLSPDQGNKCLACSTHLDQAGVLCEGCATQYEGCVSCGALLTDSQTIKPKDDWIARLMINVAYTNEFRLAYIRDQLYLMDKDTSKEYRMRHALCRTCYYMDNYMDTKDNLKKLYGCQSCGVTIAGLKKAPRTMCEPCGVKNRLCIYCGQHLD